ncbi:MAG: hypothetical protein R3C18_05585 [Planctomycetaceae bacterium]
MYFAPRTSGDGPVAEHDGSAGIPGADDDGDQNLAASMMTLIGIGVKQLAICILSIIAVWRFIQIQAVFVLHRIQARFGRYDFAGETGRISLHYDSHYGQFWENEEVGDETLHGVNTMVESIGGLMQPGGVPGLLDEPDEMIHESNFRHTNSYRADGLFGPEETAALRLTDRDAGALGQRSVVKNLASFNLRDNTQAATVREQFTTTSFDRNEFGFSYWPTRPWEFNDIFNDGGALPTTRRFPPAFGPGRITSRHELLPTLPGSGNPACNFASTNPAANVTDPFRPVVRRLLTIDLSRNSGGIGGGRMFPQHRLDINRLLVNFDQNGNPVYRELMPHPVIDPSATDSTPPYLGDPGDPARPLYHGNAVTGQSYYDRNTDGIDLMDPQIPQQGSFRPVPLSACSTNKFAQEAWARHDRQRLARDIYVLLYTLSGLDPTAGDTRNFVDIGHDLAQNDGGMPPVYEVRRKLREMAQFAVNYVDALDRDDVITRFEFDYNLTDGWDIPATSASDEPDLDPDPNTDSYGVVYGVEAVSLTLSETLVIRAADQPSDYGTTLHRDNDGPDEHRFLYIELRNNSPLQQPLLTDSWRIARVDRDANVVQAAVSFKGTLADSKSVSGGGNFLIATCDDGVTNSGGDTIPADFYADFTGDNKLEAFAPVFTSVTPQLTVDDKSKIPTAASDLDLHADDPAHTNYYTWLNGGRLAEALPAGSMSSTLSFDLVLQRRRNLYGGGFGESDWIEVDRVKVDQPYVFDPDSNGGSDDQTSVRDELLGRTAPDRLGIWSFERPEPFAGEVSTPHNSGNGPHTYPTHTLEPVGSSTKEEPNAALVGPSFSAIWQPHFNRDFASLAELMSVPLYGYRNDVNSETIQPSVVSPLDGPLKNLAETIMGGLELTGHKTAERRFLYPDSSVAGVPSNVENNRWFRILSLLEVPLEDGRTLDNLVTVKRRQPGKVNLNTLVHETVFAGVMDDPAFNARNPANWQGGGGVRLTDDLINSYNRFDEFLKARDGIDALSGRSLPGIPGSRPFKPLGAVGTSPADSVNDTVFRVSPSSASPQYRLFSATDASALDADPHTEKRLMGKIANLTTTRSHVYAMWISYQMHDCHVVSDGTNSALQIGAVAEDFPMKRMFCLVDMSRLEEAYDPVTNTFDYRKFIIYEQPLP